MSSVLKYGSPCLLIRPRRRRSPEECSREVRPSQLAKCRAVGKRWMSTTEARSAGGEGADAWDLQQPLDNGIVFAEARELAIDLLAALPEGVDLGE